MSQQTESAYEVLLFTNMEYDKRGTISKTHGSWPITFTKSTVTIDELMNDIRKNVYMPKSNDYKYTIYMRLKYAYYTDRTKRDHIELCIFDKAPGEDLYYDESFDIINLRDMMEHYTLHISGHFIY